MLNEKTSECVPNKLFDVVIIIFKLSSYCGMVEKRKAFSLISSRRHCQRPSTSRISDMLRAVFELAANLKFRLS